MDMNREMLLNMGTEPIKSFNKTLSGTMDNNFMSVKQEVSFLARSQTLPPLKNQISFQNTLLTQTDNESTNVEQASSSNVYQMDCKIQASHEYNMPVNNHCEGKETNLHSNVTNGKLHSRGQIDIIDISTEEACNYKYFFVYEDQMSKFIVLKALRNNTAREVAVKLLDIFAIIGAPQVLQSSNGRNYAEQVVQELRSLWKDFLILHGDIPGCEGNSRDFKNLLTCWLQKNPTKSWYEGLKFIQIYENSTFRCDNGKIPYDVLFGQDTHERFQRLTSDSVLKRNIWTEEGWLDFLSNNKQTDNNVQEEKLAIEESTVLSTRDADNHVRDYDSDSHSGFKEEPPREEHCFKFVNVKSELSLNMQPEDSVFEDETQEGNKTKSPIENEDLKCNICEKRYMKPGHLKNHMKTHEKGKKFECTLCNKTFHVLNLYKKHMRQSHDQNKLSGLSRRRRKKEIATEDKESELQKSDVKSERASNLNSGDVEPNPANEYDKNVRKPSLPGKWKLSTSSRSSKLNGLRSHVCMYCKQRFSFPSVLKRHMRSHTNERPYICEVCNKSFKQLGHLSQHSLTHNDYRAFQCAVCGVKFESLDSLKVHFQSHNGESVFKTRETFRLFECDNCKKVFTTKSVLERHIFTHTHERQFGCKICGKRFKQAGHVKSHMLVHTGERKFECTVCLKRFSLSNSLKKHMYVHNGEKPYQCDVCGARFLEKRNLNGHLMTHTNERPFRCKICGKRYTLADTLRRHISAAHEDGRTYQCEICAKMFKQLAHLSVHKKVHNDERPFQCHLCAKNFKHKNVLKSHLAIHANIRPFECDVCKATFVRKTNLQTHIASAHMNERPYACTICGKRFKQISHLNGHVVVHSNSMPYQCDFCDRRCNRLDNLKKHMRLHTKNKE